MVALIRLVKHNVCAIFADYVYSIMTLTDEQLSRLKFPIGPFTAPDDISKTELASLINGIEESPAAYRTLTAGLSDAGLAKTYRDGAWSIRQIVNHVADMQMLHLFRMKRAITEPDYDKITIVDQHAWALTPDGLNAPVTDSLDMFEGITKRFVFLMRSLDEKQLATTYYHPIRKISLNQKQAIAMTAWHVRHHIEHIRIALSAH